MPLFVPFAHYLAYGATDQETFRSLRDIYNGILVPATIAAWQRHGTGGFVLSLSATDDAPPYIIDPRFPLFQQGLAAPKQSHRALAELLGDRDLIRHSDPTPDDFPDTRLEKLAQNWVTFNTGYGVTSNEKFDKYAKRLGESVEPEQAQKPEAILAPYFACESVEDPWWARSVSFYDRTRSCSGDDRSLRVVCARHSRALAGLLADLDASEQVVVWVSGLNEHTAAKHDLAAYRRAITVAKQRDQDAFALYGGFFSVLLGAIGLSGAAHGVGFSEHRYWRELPESGAPPARFYLRRAHRYVPQDVAQILWEGDSTLTVCPCPYCDGREPIALDYHQLMKHSVWCRSEEIKSWYGIEPADASRLLSEEYAALTREIAGLSLVSRIRDRSMNAIAHLPTWAAALVES
jgi:hypothetical protein